MNEIKQKEVELRKFPETISISQQINLLQWKWSELTIKEMEIKMNNAKQKTFEFANNPGK